MKYNITVNHTGSRLAWITKFCNLLSKYEPGSSVGIATGYELDGPGIEFSGFGGLGVCVLASGTQDCGFAPDRSRRTFHNGKIHGTQSFVEYQNKVHDTEQSKAIKKIPVGALFFAPVQTGPGAHPTSLYNGYRVFPEGGMRPGHDADPSPPSRADV
jgi:hypothetical protein